MALTHKKLSMKVDFGFVFRMLEIGSDDEGEQCHWKKDQKEEAGWTRHRLGAVAPVIEVAKAPRRVVVEISGIKMMLKII